MKEEAFKCSVPVSSRKNSFFFCFPLRPEKLSLSFFFRPLLSSAGEFVCSFLRARFFDSTTRFAGPEANNLAWHRSPQERKRTPLWRSKDRAHHWRPLSLCLAITESFFFKKKDPNLLSLTFFFSFFAFLDWLTTGSLSRLANYRVWRITIFTTYRAIVCVCVSLAPFSRLLCNDCSRGLLVPIWKVFSIKRGRAAEGKCRSWESFGILTTSSARPDVCSSKCSGTLALNVTLCVTERAAPSVAVDNSIAATSSRHHHHHGLSSGSRKWMAAHDG